MPTAQVANFEGIERQEDRMSVLVELQDAQRQEAKPLAIASRIPHELLILVFAHLAQAPPLAMRGPNTDRDAWVTYFKNLQPTVVTQVCCSWRAASLSAKSLWSNLRVELHFHPIFVYDFLDNFVARALAWSGDSRLDIYLRLVMMIYPMSRSETDTDKIYVQRTRQVLDTICRVQNRWRSAEILPVPANGMIVLRPVELKSVQLLNLRAQYGIAADNHSMAFPTLLNLRELHLSPRCNLDILEYVKFGQLEALSIFCPSHFRRGRQRLLNILSQLACTVRHFVLEVSEGLGDADDKTEISAETLLAFVDFPVLEKISLRDVLPNTMLTLTSSLLRYRPPLVSAAFRVHEDVEDNGQSIARFICNTPLLVHLEVKLPSDKGTIMSSLLDKLTAKVDGAFVVIPRLETLNLHHVRAPLSSFVGLITSRWDVPKEGRTFSGIKLFGCVYTVPNVQHGIILKVNTPEFSEEVSFFVKRGLSLQVLSS